jgi:DNA-binding NarL/FixJ family response regulator
LLAEDHEAVAVELAALLRTERDVVGVVGDGRSLVEAARWLRPDVIVTDITMPVVDGLAAAAALLRDGGGSCGRVVFVTVHADAGMVERGLAVGATGYVLNLLAGDDLLPAIRAAARGERYVSPMLVERPPPSRPSTS